MPLTSFAQFIRKLFKLCYPHCIYRVSNYRDGNLFLIVLKGRQNIDPSISTVDYRILSPFWDIGRYFNVKQCNQENSVIFVNVLISRKLTCGNTWSSCSVCTLIVPIRQWPKFEGRSSLTWEFARISLRVSARSCHLQSASLNTNLSVRNRML